MTEPRQKTEVSKPNGDPAPESPRHGFQGDRAPATAAPAFPASLTVAISREAGSRGGTIARRAARKLGWQIYNQELLEYIAQEGSLQQPLADNLPPDAVQWVGERLQALVHERKLGEHPSILELCRIVLTLGAQGEAILIGRGAGCILPPESTLHVRIIAPLVDRIAYMSQWLRLSVGEAAVQVAVRDRRRAEFIEGQFHRQPGDIYQYDLILNSSLLGEEVCAELIAQATQAKITSRHGSRKAAPGP